jgi:hypothetical protein
MLTGRNSGFMLASEMAEPRTALLDDYILGTPDLLKLTRFRLTPFPCVRNIPSHIS